MDMLTRADELGELLEFVYMCPIGILSLGGDGTVEMLNPLAAQLLMPLASRSAIDNLFVALERVAPDLRNLAEHFAQRSGVICRDHRIFVGTRKPGPRVLSCTLIKVSDVRLMAVLSDVTAIVEQEMQLRQTESWLAAVISDFKEFALLNLDKSGRIMRWSASMQQQSGYADADALGRSMQFLFDPAEVRASRAEEQIETAEREGWYLDELWLRRTDGGRFWCQILVAKQSEDTGRPEGFSVVLRDATRGRITCDELRRMVTTDHLTGAANRMHLTNTAAREIGRSRRYGRPLSLIILDIDHFKRVNDTYGHRVGDGVLRHVVEVTRGVLRGADLLARLGGEEFAALLPEMSLDEAAVVAERLRHAVASTPARHDETLVPVTISLGCACLSADAEDLETLMEAADQALYRAKRSGRNRVELTPQSNPAPALLDFEI